ncbi:hypothetical protein NQ318_017238 [Aromia moschata]|uniref:Endonuclease/exonuclease/phosphatase domain-containing protein n=1 Tax=Aromia moschata TaxID=1265417 RepID=A0AAV8YN43_9CUCU|nr:hypothetical protein NQ318_017238 [Aromia moschata]
MDQYIRDFDYDPIVTEKVENAYEANEVLKVNNKVCNFKIIHNNIRSLPKNIDEFNVFLHQFDSNFECIVLTETFKIPDLSLFNIAGYTTIYNEGNVNKNDGIVIYIKSDIQFSHEILQVGSIKIINLKVTYLGNKIRILAIYRPPSTCPYEFNAGLREILEIHKVNADYQLLIGDINIDIFSDYEYAEDYKNLLSEHGFISVINCYTRVQANAQSCLDHIFVNTLENINDFILPLLIASNITDHYMTVIQIVLSKHLTDTCMKKKNTKTYINKKRLKSEISKISWNSLYLCGDIESATNNFIGQIKSILEKCTVIKKLQKKEIKRKEWITSGLVTSINRRDKMYAETQNDPDNAELLTKFKKYRNTLSALIKKAKINYFKKQIDQQCQSSKAENHIKYLGIVIDKHLRWDYHIKYICDKLRAILFKFKYLKQIFDIEHMKTLYYSLVESHITYGMVGWGDY